MELKDAVLELAKLTGKELTGSEAEEATKHLLKETQPENNWTDLQAMMDDIREYSKNNGRAVVENDLPMQLKLGWRCTNTGKSWFIRIADVKKSLEKMTVAKQDLLNSALQTQEGKENLIRVLNSKE